MNNLYEVVDNVEKFRLDEGKRERNYIDIQTTEGRPEEGEDLGKWREYTKSNPWRFKSNRPDSCPVCNAELGLIYGYNQTSKSMHAAGEFEYDDDGWFNIPWKCKKCGAEGVVIFQVEYWSQGVFTKDGMVEVSECGIKPEW